MKSKNKQIYQSNFSENRLVFHKTKAEYWINQMCNWLFCNEADFASIEFFELKEMELQQILTELFADEKINQPAACAELFFEKCSAIYQKLVLDLDAILEFDPAATSKNEIIITYPGFFAIVVHRIAHELMHIKSRILARFIAEYAHSKTGIDIHPSAIIGENFFIDHGTGIVIGATTVIGKNVKIYQGVTLGALNVSKADAEIKRHPTLEDHVIIYANATILGGETTIGHHSIIGGNVWITNSIPPYSMVFHKSEISIKSKNTFPEALNFSI